MDDTQGMVNGSRRAFLGRMVALSGAAVAAPVVISFALQGSASASPLAQGASNVGGSNVACTQAQATLTRMNNLMSAVNAQIASTQAKIDQLTLAEKPTANYAARLASLNTRKSAIQAKIDQANGVLATCVG